MEYLMTYGWAILIIAVVLGALFGLGFFNSANLAPKVTAGSCQVYRPQGPGTTSFINLEGTCNNELPQYVGKFNGVNGYINTGTLSSSVIQQISLGAWVYLTAYQNWILLNGGGSGSGRNWNLGSENSANGEVLVGRTSSNWVGTATSVIPLDTWTYVFYTDNGLNVNIYVNGALVQTGSYTSSAATAPAVTYIGEYIGGGSWYFPGLVSNVQIYNTSLSANEVTALYDEGIGGVPINLNNLVGWWPLNGNANDYSGNQNNGIPNNMVYTTSWTSGYTAP